MNEPRVFKNSPAVVIVIVIIFLVLIGGIVFTTGLENSFIVLPMAAFGLFVFGLIFVANSSKVIITDEEITAQNLFGSRTLRWTEINRVSGRGYEIKLHNYDEDVTVHPSSGLPGYEQIVDLIGAKRPDLFSPQEYGEMRRGIVPFMLMALVILLILGAMVAFVIAALSSSDTPIVSLLPLAVFGFIVFVIGGMMLSIPQAVTLDGYSLNLKYLFSERSIRADEIKYIQFWYTQSRNGKHYYIALHLMSGKQLRLSGLGVSMPIAYLVMKNWHQANMRGQSANMPQNNIAPNWSDNSGR
ncbi:MAG: PH domain-containing protein [Anaerolineales bacterium]|nr:PH domain-containing protein [Anaerolineales bacterium]